MKSICNERNVIQIVSNDRYIAVIGCGITILERATFAFVHRFAGIRHIHGGIFLDDDVLAVFTGEQRLYFFQISEKNSYGSVHAHRNLHQLGICSAVQYPVLIKSFVLLKAIRAWKTTFCY